MFQYILGIIMDPNGYYLSFGQYTENFTDSYFCLHGRSFLASLLASNWVNTHKDLSWSKKEIQRILKADRFGYHDYDTQVFQDFEKYSHLGYTILLNSTCAGYDPLTYGYIPKNLTYPQIMSLLELRSDILYSGMIETDFSIGGKYSSLSIYEWYQELEEQGRQRIRLK